MRLTIRSFGFAHAGPSEEASWVADVRDIPASTVDGFEDRDGTDAELQALIMETGSAQAWQRKLEFDAIPTLVDDDLIEVGCTAGRHRSVAFVEAVAETLTRNGHTITIEHRDIALELNDDAADPADSESFDWILDAFAERLRDTSQNVATMNNPKPQAPAFWTRHNEAEQYTEVYIYDQIGMNFWGEGIAAKAIIEELNSIDTDAIHVHVNSPGGSVFDGVAIFNALQRHKATITVYVDGLAASIASIIALAGNKVVMADNALFMIHNPWGWAMGTAEDMRREADVLDKIRDTLVGTYAAKTGKGAPELEQMLNDETWMTAKEALAHGFIDEIGNRVEAAASFDLSRFNYRRAPQPAAAAPKDPTTGGSPADGNPGVAPSNTSPYYLPGVGFVGPTNPKE